MDKLTAILKSRANGQHTQAIQHMKDYPNQDELLSDLETAAIHYYSDRHRAIETVLRLAIQRDRHADA